MEDYEQSRCPKGAVTDKNVELVHSLIIWTEEEACMI